MFTPHVCVPPLLGVIRAIACRDRVFLTIVKYLAFWKKPLGRKFFSHFLKGTGSTLSFKTINLLNHDDNFRSFVCWHILRSCQKDVTKSQVTIPQWVYSNQDHRFAFGTLTVFWEREGQKVHLWFESRYRWHPDQERITRPVHQAASNLLNVSAKEFSIKGLSAGITYQELKKASRLIPSRSVHLL